jgi:hypothetical protein
MRQNNYIALILLLIFVSLVALFFRRWMVDALIEAINNFRGGPPTPMHPSPSNDAALLRKRSRKSED